MKFITLLEELLNELSPKQVYEKFYSNVPYDVFKKIIKSDPRTKIVGGDIHFIGKYAKLLLNLYIKKTLKLEDLDKAREYLTYVYKHNISLDIKKIKYISDIYDIVKRYMAEDTKDLDVILSALSEDDYKLIHNGEKWYVFVPKTERGACYLGVSTQWCTTYGPNSLNDKYKDRYNPFNNYNKQGKLYIIINKSNHNEKYQFHFPSDQFMDIEDKRVDIKKILGENLELLHFFFPSFIKDVSVNEIVNEISNLKYLPDDYSYELITKFFNLSKTKNELVRGLIDEDIEKIEQYIDDDNIKSIDIKENWLSLYVKKTDKTIDDLSHYITSLKGYYDDPSDFIYYDIINLYSDQGDDLILPYIVHYFEKNTKLIEEETGINDKTQFITKYQEKLSQNTVIGDEFIMNTTHNTSESLQNIVEDALSDIKKFINIDYDNEIHINVNQFIIYLIKQNITQISDMVEVISNYLEFFDMDKNDEYLYDLIYQYQVTYPTQEQMYTYVEDFFLNLFHEQHEYPECSELRKKLNYIIKTVFNGNMTVENDNVSVTITDSDINCENGTVPIRYKNKKTNGFYSGDVKVTSLPDYVLNYKLFENYIRYKNILTK